VLSQEQSRTETYLNYFVYAYLCRNPCWPDEIHKLAFFRELNTYFSHFKYSRNPLTICWIVEILHMVSEKYKLASVVSDHKQRQEYSDLLTEMLRHQAAIISNGYKINFEQNQTYSFVALPPTVYELLWRYNYNLIRRNAPKDKKDDTHLVFFNFSKYHQLREQRFEYTPHKDSIFSNMDVLVSESLDQHDYKNQEDFFDTLILCVKHSISDEENYRPEEGQILRHTKAFTLLTLAQVMCPTIKSLMPQDIPGHQAGRGLVQLEGAD
jgi:hypothetical protein